MTPHHRLAGTAGFGLAAGQAARRAVLFALLWWALAEGAPGAWGVGAVAVALATAASLILHPPHRVRLSWIGLARFAGFFLWQSLRAGVAVAAMALRPRLAIRPAVRVVPLRLPSPAARILLANTLSLLPGTLSIGLDDDGLRLHVLDARRDTEAEVRRAEAHVARMLCLELMA